MNSKFKKIVSVVLITSLFAAQTASAVRIRDLFDVSGTPPSEWTSSATGQHYFYSGSYNFTFSGKNNYAPWFNASAPSFNRGCGGMSIKGMFMSMLNLNEIKEQLSNAGAALAWGVLLSLRFSIPGIATVFQDIQKWARAIQKLLANMCSIGQREGTAFWKATGVQNAIDDMFAANNKEGGLFDKLHDKSEKGLSAINDFIDAKCPQLTSSAKENCESKKAGPHKAKTKKLSKAGVNFTAMIAGKKSNVSKDIPKNKIFTSRLSQFLNDGKIGASTDDATIADNNLKLLGTILPIVRVFFGDFAVSNITIQNLLKTMDKASDSHGDTYTFNKEKLKSDYKAQQSGTAAPLQVSFARIAPIISDPKNIAQALLFGFNSNYNDKYCDDGYCYIEDNYVIYLDWGAETNEDDSGNIETLRYFGNLMPDNDSNKKQELLKVEWEGAVLKSFKKIKWLVANYGGGAKHGKGSFGIYEGDNIEIPSSDPDKDFKILIPGISKYVKVIGSLEIANEKQESLFTASLKAMLAKYNAYLYSIALMNTIEGKVKQAISNDSLTISDLENIGIILSQVYDATQEVKRELDKTMDIVKLNKTISEIFTQIDKERRMDISNKLR